MVDKSSSSLYVEANQFSYNELFNSQHYKVARELRNLDRSNGGGRVPTPSPPNPNLKIRWNPLPSPPPPASPS
uniref:Uncharacterized protein n=1 Tax=Solanum tuberosum TaxID=4113 RepID=M1CDZ4_SOLTU